ncbi:hypothetical protein SAMN05421837_107354 [Amycolatopsis pretoriensis]|uniref:Uncharacterized protein n=1 Tax=Amycolatopsis pretoriensis TaxID=218821 RepID=A0A1H5R7N3_9PSEU|nr:hypothetical protein [Amycolatopsis pretoriensis]SEF34383.1 hypothetical protein SAMN05421837_107354 [Amycolatopsis pretoriensis]
MAVLDRVPTDRINARAKALSAGRVALTVVAAVLFGLGWLIAKALGGAWFVLAWCFAAIQVGWNDARGRD